PNNFAVTGRFAGTVNFGGATLTASGNDVFVAVLQDSGKHVWSNRFGNNAIGTTITMDGANNAIVAGSFSNTIDFGGGALMSAGQTVLFLAKLGTGGGYLWAKRFGDTTYQWSGGQPGYPIS